MAEEEILEQVVSIRNRPIGVSRSRFGVSLVAVERGYFPISSTGYRSLSGYDRGGAGPVAFEPGLLDSLAEAEDRERKALLTNLHRAAEPQRDSLSTFIHVSLYVDKAINDGFFAPDHDRAPLWQGAHRLLNLVHNDPRFQPAPNGTAWKEEHCRKALTKMEELHGFLKRFAQADYSGEPPMPLFGAKAYMQLPPKVVAEPIIALHKTPVALSLALPGTAAPESPIRRTHRIAIKPVTPPDRSAGQLNLFANDEIRPPVPRITIY